VVKFPVAVEDDASARRSGIYKLVLFSVVLCCILFLFSSYSYSLAGVTRVEHTEPILSTSRGSVTTQPSTTSTTSTQPNLATQVNLELKQVGGVCISVSFVCCCF
jgi:uncharacterized membrane protein SpoIIM required for sporulation